MEATINTYDVWGNAEDGYDVNDVFKYGNYVFNGDRTKDADILEYLNDVFFAKSHKLSDIEINDNSYNILYINSAIDGQPICEIVFAEPF